MNGRLRSASLALALACGAAAFDGCAGTDGSARVDGVSDAGTGGHPSTSKPRDGGMDAAMDAGKKDARVPPLPPPVAPNIAAIFKTGCATASLPSEIVPSNVLFVIDRSASMACNPPPITDSATCEANPVRADLRPSKWEIVRTALKNAIDALSADSVVGITYFSNDDACGVQSNPSVPLAKLDDAQRSALKVSLDNVEPNGATPLVGATILAYGYLHELALKGAIRGKQFVVLLTDGQQSDACSDPAQCSGQQDCTNLLVNKEVGLAAGPGVGIDTFAIGAPGSEPARRVLSQIAKNGGTALVPCDVDAGNCHFDMTTNTQFDKALPAALTSISGRVLQCELPTPRPDAGQLNHELVNVVYSPPDGGAPSLIGQDDKKCDSNSNSWQYGDNGNKIVLCGAACDRARRNPGSRVDVVLGCPVMPLQ